MNKKLFCKVFMFFIVLSFFWLGTATKSSAYTKDDIGMYPGDNTPGDAVAGVQLYCDGKLLGYAFDVWNYSKSDGWKHVSTNVDGQTLTTAYHQFNSSLIWIRNAEDNPNRFDIVVPMLKSKLTADRKYSIVIDRYMEGKHLLPVVETPYTDEKDLNKNISLQIPLNQGDSFVGCGSYYERCPSYIYSLYTILEIGTEAEIRTAGAGYQIDQPGEAYYNGSDYIIQSLPEVTPQMEGYQCSLLGWYDAPEGGKQYQAGDSIQKSTVLYPHWNKKPLKYSVKCIDVLGNSSSGQKLGESFWEQEYDSIAYGSSQGCIPMESIYYEGMVYTGCSEMTVKLSGNTVYRYFAYAEYPVQIKDQISTGPNTGQSLGSTSKWYSYGTVVDGNVIGSNAAVGAYYTGYSFLRSTSDIVGRNGSIVYRYFKPVQYNICLDGNGASSGTMAEIRDCRYDENHVLTANSYSKEINITLDLQAEEASCDTNSITAKQRFMGWAESRDGSVRYSDKANVKNLMSSNGTCTLYAVWEAAGVTITAQPKRMGYQFVGWSENPEAVSGKMEFSLKENTTLYAIWKADVVNYHVEYYKENMQGTYEKTANYQLSNYTDAKVSVQDSIPAYPGFYLDSKSSILEGTVSGDGSLVLVAYYRRNTYHVTFEDKTVGAEELEDLELSGIFEAEIQIPEYSVQKEGYYFAGWTADPEIGQIYCKAGDIYRIPNHDQKLYAVWKPNSYKVKFDANISAGEQEQAEGTMSTLNGYYGESLLLPACEWTRKGYDFAGWNTKADASGEFYQDAEEVESLYEEDNRSITLYAVWKPIHGSICYQANVPENCSGVLKGKMETTNFQYDQFMELPDCGYQLKAYQFVEWNTEADGSGQSFSPGESVKKIFSSKEDNILYAIWKAQEDTRFILSLEKETLDGGIRTETMVYSGTTDTKLSDAIIAYYAGLGQEVDRTDFIFGYQVTNPEVLEENRITADGESIVTLKLIRKEFSLKILRDAQDEESDIYFQDSAKYETMYTLPEEVSGVGQIERYIDAEGNVYQSGTEICMDHDINLMAQHRLTYDLGSEKKEEYVSHNMPIVLEKPQETMYSFEGWYRDPGLRDYVGTDQSVVYLYTDTVLYPKWSKEKISYHISYRSDDGNEVILLGGQTESYHCGDKVFLPVASQVVVPEGYQFAGWYESGDETQTICTEITETQYGDKIYCLKLKAIETQRPEETQQPEGSSRPEETQQPEVSSRPEETRKPETSRQPDGTETPEETKKPNDNIAQEGQNNSDQDTVLSNSNNRLEDKLNTAVSKKISNQNAVTVYTKAGIQYQMINKKKHTLRVYRVKSAKKVISIPKTVRINGSKYKVTQIGSKAFRNCKNTQTVKLGTNVKRICKNAFYGMKKLKKIVIRRKKAVKIEKSILPASGKKIRISVPKKRKEYYQKVFQKEKNNRIYVAGRK